MTDKSFKLSRKGDDRDFYMELRYAGVEGRVDLVFAPWELEDLKWAIEALEEGDE